jgi:hypothetical protein
MQEETARTVWIAWGLAVFAVGLGFILGGPYWGADMVALGALLLIRGHFPKFFESQFRIIAVAILFVLFTGGLLCLRYQWFSSPSHEQAARNSAQTSIRKDEASTRKQTGQVPTTPSRSQIIEGFLSKNTIV